MKILIIGVNGFIGSNAAFFFSKKGYDISGCDVVGEKAPMHKSFFLIEPQRSDFESIFRKGQYNVCINASGSAHVGYSFDDPEKDFELNVLNVNRLLVAIRKHNPKCKFINFSSAAVYGNPVRLPITEDMEVKPLSPYGFHKLQSEYLLTEYHKFFGLHTCSLRVFSAFGPFLRKQLFWDLYQKSLQNTHIELFGTGEESRDFIFIEDLLQAVEIIIHQAPFEGDIINVASGYETKIKDVVQTFYQLLNPGITFNFSGKIKMGDPNNWQAHIGKLKNLGFKPKYDVDYGLQKLVQWLGENESE
jgi:UDP-glucose 4-epimerase